MQNPPTPVLSWQTLHLTDTGTRGPAVLGLLSTLLGLTTLLVAVRIYTRWRITHGFGSDDVLILAAYTMATAFTAAGIAGELTLQWGRHVWDVLPGSVVPGLKLTLTIQVLFDGATNLTKLSMLALFVRITLASGQLMARRMALCLSGIVTASAIVFLLVDVFQCRPVSAFWTLSTTAQRQCINQTKHLLVAGTINTAADLVIAVVFPFQYWSAVDKAKAVSRSGSGSTARTVFTFQSMTSTDGDVTWNTAPALMASALELNIGI
ncbi:hypothetical protein SCUCBS95973_002534 [Sporothrix curviconia]|uniref:Rhodopsin domain-containing protein n=1 Tax=Sporothrix curviconia TaxID=1260050 RepID=A0ABP0B7N6_9PEZI